MLPDYANFHSTAEGQLNNTTSLQMVRQEKVVRKHPFRTNRKIGIYRVLFVCFKCADMI